MKPRRVLLSIEVETDAPITILKKPHLELRGYHFAKIIQTQVNVIKKEKK